MAAVQRVLLFQLAVGVLAGAAFLGLYFATRNPYAANAGWSVLAVLALSDRVMGKAPIDERDELVLDRSMMIGYRVFWFALVIGCASVPFAVAPRQTVDVSLFTFIPMAGWCLLTLTRSTVGLVLHNRVA